MAEQLKYTIITVESYPFGFETKYFYLPVGFRLEINDVIQAKSGKRYRIIDGKTQLNFEDIDLTKYELFEWN